MRRKIKLFLAQYLFFPLLRWLFYFQKMEIEGMEEFKKAASQGALLLSLWHENLAILPYLLDRELREISLCAVTSKSQDGEILESFKKHFPNLETIRVRHNARHGSLKSILSALQKGRVIVMTPDGPQGPWKKLKPGLECASSRTNSPIWCLSWSCRKRIHLGTKDRMKLPWLFQKIQLRFQEAGISSKEKKREEQIYAFLE